jgi:hypothetical protein
MDSEKVRDLVEKLPKPGIEEYDDELMETQWYEVTTDDLMLWIENHQSEILKIIAEMLRPEPTKTYIRA